MPLLFLGAGDAAGGTKTFSVPFTRMGLGGHSAFPLVGALFANKEAAVVSVRTYTGGFWVEYRAEMDRRERARKKREKKRKLALKLQNELDRALAIAERELEENSAREEELSRLTEIAQEYKDELIKQTNGRVSFIALEAINRHTYSTMERFERELGKLHKEEEEFILLATELLVMNQ